MTSVKENRFIASAAGTSVVSTEAYMTARPKVLDPVGCAEEVNNV